MICWKRMAELCLAVAMLTACAPKGPSQIGRGKYLVSIAGCSDCHTPGGFSPKPDKSRYLGGSDVDFQLTGMGVFAPPNLTPDRATGLGNWTSAQIAAAITTGVRPDGRVLSPAMPWSDFANLSQPDVEAIVAYLQSLPAVSHKVPAPRPAKPCVDGALQCIVQRPGG